MPFTTPDQFQTLRLKARQLLKEGGLPPAPRVVFAGEHQGPSETCAVCALIIGRQQLSYEVDIEVGDQKRMVHVHPNCHAAWAAESR